ncbi:hypothetical protein SAMN05216550_11837 [Paraburkholderia tropica]|uniref:Cellulase (Glycosyl hydrolase family 5) n=1 Tax=Paraburkholderia tropica TaxID=92647 RepID=A0AAQ1GKS2_9BURK|nr:hypothetical protein SAMN05216550_11837 [Paraburkholderia tropica]
MSSSSPASPRSRAQRASVFAAVLALTGALVFACTPVAAAASFYRFDIPKIAPHSIADFSALNAPLEAADRLTSCGNTLCTKHPVRLFGVNLLFGAALPNAAEGAQLAQRLRALGVNFVRLHGLDSIASSNAGGPTGLLTAGPFPTLNDEALTRLRAFLEQLRSNGIYTDLNLHVAYTFRPDIDHTQALPDGRAWPTQSKPLQMIDETAIRLQALYAQRLLEALRGAGEPSLAVVEINNESSLVYHWMDGTLARLVTSPLRDTLRAQWLAYCAAHRIAPDDDEDDRGVVPLDTRDATRAAAYLDFLVDKDRQYLDTIARAIRQANDHVLVIGTQMNFGTLANFRSLANMDVIDAHFYVDQYAFPGGMWRWNNWQITDRSNIGTGLIPLIGAAFYRSLDKPFLITEFNQPWPNRQASEILPETVAFASLQDWSGLTFHDYAQTREGYDTKAPLEFSLAGDATKLVQFGQAAWAFRTRAIAPLNAVAPYRFDNSVMLDAVKKRTMDGIAALLEQRGVAKASAPFTARVGFSATDAPLPAAQADSTNPTVNTTTQPDAQFDMNARTTVIDAPAIEGVTGYLEPGRAYRLGNGGRFQLKLDRSTRGFVSLMLSARDGRTIEHSRSMLLTLPGYAVGSTASAHGPAPLDLTPASPPLREALKNPLDITSPRWRMADPATQATVNLRAIEAPVWMERIACTFSFSSDAKSLRVFALDASGQRRSEIAARFIRKTATGFEIDLQVSGQTPAPWFEISASD